MHKIKKVFVVDDEPDICLTLTEVLEGNGFVVHVFDVPLFALENFRKGLYHVLILDIKMQKMNGLELYKEIKKIDNKVKICFLTASEFNYRAFTDVLGDLKENQFIQKPIRNEELIKIVNGIISST